MKYSVFALLTTASSALDPLPVPTGTAVVDCGECDEMSYAWWWDGADDLQYCVKDSECTQPLDGLTTKVCLSALIGEGISGAISTGFCWDSTTCDDVNQAIDGSEDTYTYVCNNLTDVSDEVKALDINDYVFWNYWMVGSAINNASVDRATCDSTTDCGTGLACGNVSLDDANGLYCVMMNGWCAEETESKHDDGEDTGYVTNGSSRSVGNSLNKFGVSCETDAYLTWFWQTNNTADQYTAAGCATVDPECTTITWDGETGVEAFCGTATMTGYSVLGCYPIKDCDDEEEGEGAEMPGSETLTYTLTCSATQLVASAAAALVVAASI